MQTPIARQDGAVYRARPRDSVRRAIGGSRRRSTIGTACPRAPHRGCRSYCDASRTPCRLTTANPCQAALRWRTASTPATGPGHASARAPDGRSRCERHSTSSSPGAPTWSSSATTDTLQALGLEVATAADGAQGIALLETTRPDLLLLLDFAMPGMNGAQVAEIVRRTRPGLPIVFATGYAESAAVEAAVGGSVVILKKPIGIADLEAVLRTALSGT